MTAGHIIGVLCKSGLKQAFCSPGSRNIPLLTALSRSGIISVNMTVDERQSAFIALGWGSIKGEAPILCCTSGTAMLNYAPAIAEAYYRHVKIVIITADRPLECLNQGEPQMIDQTNALKSVVAGSVDIYHNDKSGIVIRKVSEAIDLMNLTNQPVHINVRFAEPFAAPVVDYVRECISQTHLTRVISPAGQLSTNMMRTIGAEIASPRKVLIYIGSHNPDATLSKAINRISGYQNIVVVGELISNLHGCKNVIYGVESILHPRASNNLDNLRPDVLITIGGTPTGRNFRQFVAQYPPGEIWRVGDYSDRNELFGRLDRMITANPADFLRQLASALHFSRYPSEYAQVWHNLNRAPMSQGALLVREILDAIPRDFNVELSNGLTIRYATLNAPMHHRYGANRGVNGIDGSTATAVGASLAYTGNTILITGDMSAQYDLGIYFNKVIDSRLRIIVIDNDGGGIFRRILPARDINEREQLICCSHLTQPLADIASVAGFEVHKTTGFDISTIKWLCDHNSLSPRMVIIKSE